MDPALLSAIITACLVVFAAVLLGWAAESLEKFIAPGLALAVLALLQTLPEYTVEAVIAWSQNTHLMIANLTGSLRLLLGFGWPMIFIIAVISRAIKHKKITKELELDAHQALETLFLVPAVLYFTIVWLKGSLTPLDGIILIVIFLWFVKTISKAKVSDAEEIKDSDMPRVVQKIVHAKRRARNFYIFSLFAIGGIVIFIVAHPFVESLKQLAVSWGISEFLFIQWVAPFVSEFPEKTTAFIWASRANKATTAMMNMVSSNLNQWLLLAGSLPLIFSISAGKYSKIIFDAHQSEEVILTILQTAMVIVCMWNAKVSWWKSGLILILWIIGFFLPAERHNIIIVHLAAIVFITMFYLFKEPYPALVKKARMALNT